MASSVPVGANEIPALLGVTLNTVWGWHRRGVLPEPDWIVNARPAWSDRRIIQWAGDTGRIEAGTELAERYEALCGRPPAPIRKGGRLFRV